MNDLEQVTHYGTIIITRTSDKCKIGQIQFYGNGQLLAIRDQGLYGPAQEQSFDNYNDCVTWIQGSQSIPVMLPSTLNIRDAGDKYHTMTFVLAELCDGKWIGVDPRSTKMPIVYPNYNRQTEKGLHIEKKPRGFSVYHNSQFIGFRKTLIAAVGLLAESTCPDSPTGHQLLQYKALGIRAQEEYQNKDVTILPDLRTSQIIDRLTKEVDDDD